MASVRTTMAIEEARNRTLERANRSKKQRSWRWRRKRRGGLAIADEGTRKKEREGRRGERGGSTWVERERERRELVCCGWEFGMRESSGRADSRRHATRAHEKLWLLPPVNGEGQPTKNNITFYGQPNFVARWWASARTAVCYRRLLSRALHKRS